MTDQRKDDGGPAFPIETTATPYAPGMTLRDWFAGHATEDDIAAHTVWTFDDELPVGYPATPDCTREQARYRYADAMLEARKQ